MKKRISMAKGTQGKAINEGFKEFVTSCKVRNLSERTIEYYQDCMEIFQEFLDSLGISVISDITSNTIDNYIIELKSRESMNDVSVNTRVRGVRAIVNYWQKIGYCQSFKITLLKTDKEIKETYTNSELKILLEKPKTNEFTTYRDWVIVNFLLATGLRIGELVNIKVCDICFEEGIVKVKRGKARRERHLPLTKTMVKIFREYLEIRKHESADDYLFCSCYGEKLTENACAHSIAKYNNRRGIQKRSVHLFRHTFAKNWILNGGDAFRLQKILGHKSLEITREYVEMFSCDLQNNYDEYNPLENIGKQKGDFISMKQLPKKKAI